MLFIALLINATIHSADTSHLHITLCSPSARTSCLSIPHCSLILYLFERLQGWYELCFIISTCSKCALLSPFTTREVYGLSHLSSALKQCGISGKMDRAGWLSLTVRAWFCVSGYSLVEEGKQVTHHDQRRPRHAQQDLTDALCSLVQVLDSCSMKHTTPIISCWDITRCL